MSSVMAVHSICAASLRIARLERTKWEYEKKESSPLPHRLSFNVLFFWLDIMHSTFIHSARGGLVK